jgi:hypothetical protein
MSTYSTNLKVQLIGTGEENNTWGTVTNNAFSNVFEQAIVGYATVNFSSDADTTLTLTDGNSSQTARNLYLNLTSSGSLSTTRNLVLPNNQAGTAPIQKLYIVKNATTGGRSIQVKTASGTGVTIPNGATMLVYSNGTDVVDVITNITSLTLTNALPVASGGTGVTTSTGSGSVVLSTSGTLTTPRLAGSSTGYSTFASSNASTTNYTITFPAENMTAGFRNIPISGSAKTGAYPLVASDVGKYIQLGSGSSVSVANSVFNQGDVVSLINTLSTGITITFNNTTANISGSTTPKGGGGTVTLAPFGLASIVFYSSTACVISGAVT